MYFKICQIILEKNFYLVVFILCDKICCQIIQVELTQNLLITSTAVVVDLNQESPPTKLPTGNLELSTNLSTFVVWAVMSDLSAMNDLSP